MILQEINLQTGDDHSHPELLNPNNNYVCVIGGNFLIGKFELIKRGLVLHTSHDITILYDKPGTVDSQWNKVYQILETVDEAVDRADFKRAFPDKWKQARNRTVRSSAGKVLLKYKPKQTI